MSALAGIYGLKPGNAALPKRTKSRLMNRSSETSFIHLVGERPQG
jgi:hypothetical protein